MGLRSLAALFGLAAAAPQPHILLMLADDMGHYNIGWRNPEVRSPTIDALAADGIKLAQYYTPSSCTPARSALMSGFFPSSVGMGMDSQGAFTIDSPYGLPLSYPLMPEILANIGYETHMVGKWNIGHFAEAPLPHRRGFESFLGYNGDEENYYSHVPFGMAPFSGWNASEWCDFMMATADRGIQVGDCHTGAYSTEIYAERLESIITAHDARGRPLFLYAAFQAIHAPADAPPPQDWAPEEEAMLATLDHVCRSGHRHTVARIVVTLDRAVRRVLGALEKHAFLNNTIIAFASDNGACPAEGGSNWPLRGNKFSNFEGGVRVPAFVWSALMPDKLRGTTFRGIFHAADWLPTFASAVGRAEIVSDAWRRANGLDALDGVDQWQALRSSAEESPVHARDEVLIHLNKWSMHLGGAEMPFNFSSGAVRVGEWKLMVNEHPIPAYKPSHNWTANCTCTNEAGAGTRFLYNVVDDPYESTNLVQTYPGIAKRIERRLLHYYRKARATAYVGADTNAYYVWMAAGGFIVPWNGTSGNGWRNYSLIHGSDDGPPGVAFNVSGAPVPTSSENSTSSSGLMIGAMHGGPHTAAESDLAR